MAFAKKTEQMAKSSLQMEAVGQQLASFSMQSAPPGALPLSGMPG